MRYIYINYKPIQAVRISSMWRAVWAAVFSKELSIEAKYPPFFIHSSLLAVYEDFMIAFHGNLVNGRVVMLKWRNSNQTAYFVPPFYDVYLYCSLKTS